MSGKPDLSDYIEVSERIDQFYEKYPKGSLRCKEWKIVEANGQTFFVYISQALRTPDDPVPAEGIAWEPVPGLTPYTKNSEAMVAETSSWGRAIAALGFEVKRGIASKQEVMNRRDVDGAGENVSGRSGVSATSTSAVSAPVGFASKKQKGFFERLLKQGGLDSNQVAGIVRFTEQLPTERVSKAIDGLNDNDSELAERTVAALLRESDAWARLQSDVPFDEAA